MKDANLIIEKAKELFLKVKGVPSELSIQKSKEQHLTFVKIQNQGF